MHSKEIINLVKEKSVSGQSYKKIALDLGLSKSTVAFMAKNNYGIKRGRPKVITKVEDFRIKREVARLKQHKEKITSRKIQKQTVL